jgi:hypothetical protein
MRLLLLGGGGVPARPRVLPPVDDGAGLRLRRRCRIVAVPKLAGIDQVVVSLVQVERTRVGFGWVGWFASPSRGARATRSLPRAVFASGSPPGARPPAAVVGEAVSGGVGR